MGGKHNVCQKLSYWSESGLGLNVEIGSPSDCAAVDRSPSISLDVEGSGIARYH